jgi:DNA polymerase I
MAHILVLDGGSFVFRAFYGNPAVGRAFKEAGEVTPDIHAMFTANARAMLMRMVRDWQPTHLVIAQDSPGGSFRHTLYPEYKAGRRRTGPSGSEMMAMLQPSLDTWGVATLAVPPFEADDIVATIARRARRRGSRVTVISGDRDLLQLVQHDVDVFLPIPGKGDVSGADFIRDSMRIRPDQIADYKAMLGDSSDNIPRIEIDSDRVRNGKAVKEGVKEQEALAYLERYGGIKGLYKDLARTPPGADPFSARERNWLLQCKQQAYRFKRLVRLRYGVPLAGLDPAATSVARINFQAQPDPRQDAPPRERRPAPAPAQMGLGI